MTLARTMYLDRALEAYGGHKSRMAKECGIDRSTLYAHLKTLKLGKKWQRRKRTS